MIVIDASALLEVLLQTENSRKLSQHLFSVRQPLVAPHLIDLELMQVIRRYHLAGELSGTRAKEAIQDLQDFPLARYPHTPLLDLIWDLRNNVTAYDAAYIALAESLQAPLLTFDRRLGSLQRKNLHILKLE